MRQVVILAGGKGSRLKSELSGAPKPLVNINGYPLLYWQFNQIKKYGFDSAILLVNYEAQQIINYCKSKDNFGLQVEFIDDVSPLGTAGSVLNVIDHLQDTFLVVYADTYFDIDLNHLWDHHVSHIGAAATIFLHPNDHPFDSDLVEVDDNGMVLSFHPYPHPPNFYFQNLVNGALYVCNRDALLKYKNISHPSDFGKDIFPKMIEDGLSILGYMSSEYIKDAGTPDRLAKVRLDVSINKPQALSRSTLKPAVFIDRDGTINEDRGYIVDAEEICLFDGVGQALQRLNHSNYISILVTNQPIVARGDCGIPQLKKIHAKLEHDLAVSGSFLNAIYYCPHHPDSGYIGEIPELKVSCGCRKPEPGMLKRAQKEHCLDMLSSWMIGDSTADFGAANAVGVSSILVETGFGGLDGRYPFIADFSVQNFSEAVDFILKKYPLIQNKITSFMNIPNNHLIFVGGLSRSGKSTLAGLLAREWRLDGHRVHIIRTDSWILEQEGRKSTVFGRHDMEALKKITKQLTSVSSQIDISIPYYLKKTRTRAPVDTKITVSQGDIVIIEGVVALELANSLELMHQSIFIKTDEAERRQRFDREYIRRGCLKTEIDQLYMSRMEDECENILKLGEQAGSILSLDFLFRK